MAAPERELLQRLGQLCAGVSGGTQLGGEAVLLSLREALTACAAEELATAIRQGLADPGTKVRTLARANELVHER